MHRDRGGTDAASFVARPVTLGRADDRPLYDFVWTTVSRGRARGRISGRDRPFTVVQASNWSELGSRCRFCRNCFIASVFSGVWASRTPRVSQNGKGRKVGARRQKKWTSPTGIRTQVVNSPLLRRKLSLESKPKVITRVWGGTPLH